MGRYQIVFARAAERELYELPLSIQQRAARVIDALNHDPRPSGVKKIAGTADLWRIRIGDYRVVYRIDDARNLIDITHIRHRKDVYR